VASAFSHAVAALSIGGEPSVQASRHPLLRGTLRFRFSGSDEFTQGVDPLLDLEKIGAKFGQLLRYDEIFARLQHSRFLNERPCGQRSEKPTPGP